VLYIYATRLKDTLYNTNTFLLSGHYIDTNMVVVILFSATDVSSAISVQCSDSDWDIRVNIDRLRDMYPSVNPSDIYLGQTTCAGQDNNRELVFSQPLLACNTTKGLVC